MRMNIVLIVLISINGIICMNDGMPIDSLPTYSNSIVTIWKYNRIIQDPCSGTIITPSHIVTTAYCVNDVRDNSIYVTTADTDLDLTISLMVHKIHRHHGLKLVYEPEELWLNNIAILHLVRELPWNLNIAPMPLNYQSWNRSTSMECYIIGHKIISTTTIIPQWSTVVIVPNSCVPPEISRLPHEIFAVSTTLATFTPIDIGTPLVCNRTATGMIVQGVENIETVAVLIFTFHKDFIEYIIAGGVAEIGESAVHVVAAIFESGKFVCGGFAVHNRYIVTAAHCVDSKHKTELLVAFSSVEMARMNPASEWASVESIVIHPHYAPISNHNLGEHSIVDDIAVLKLKSDLPWNPLIRLKDLPDPELISGDRPCEILRWTDPSSGDTESKIVMRSYVTVHNRNEAFHLEAEEFSAEGLYDLPIATTKDIGNPITFENNIIGMVIDIGQTGMDFTGPVICLKIRKYEAFIKEVMNRI